MEISSSSNNITIAGNIKSIADFKQIKETIDGIKTLNNEITLNLKDSISITSSVIGYLNKLVLKDEVVIHLNVGNAQLMELLEDLNLVSVLNAKKV